jgi:transposase
MLSISGQVKVFLAAQPTDMRKSFDTLAALVQEVLKLDPLSGHLFVFRGKRADRVKILWWDVHGYAIWYKKLELHYPHCFLFTGIGEVADNRARQPPAVGGMDSSSTKTGPRRRPMPREIADIAPPRAEFSAGPKVSNSCGIC